MASDAYISSYDKTGSKTTHINSSGAISATMQYAIWDKVSLSARLVFPDSATAETELRSLFLTGKNDGRFCVITVPK